MSLLRICILACGIVLAVLPGAQAATDQTEAPKASTAELSSQATIDALTRANKSVVGVQVVAAEGRGPRKLWAPGAAAQGW